MTLVEVRPVIFRQRLSFQGKWSSVSMGCGFIDRLRVTARPGQGRGRRLVTRGGPPFPFKGCSNWLPIGLPPASGHAHVAGLYLETLFSFSLCLVSGCAVPARSYPTGNVRPHIRARSQPRIRGRPTTYLCLLLWSPRDMQLTIRRAKKHTNFDHSFSIGTQQVCD